MTKKEETTYKLENIWIFWMLCPYNDKREEAQLYFFSSVLCHLFLLFPLTKDQLHYWISLLDIHFWDQYSTPLKILFLAALTCLSHLANAKRSQAFSLSLSLNPFFPSSQLLLSFGNCGRYNFVTDKRFPFHLPSPSSFDLIWRGRKIKIEALSLSLYPKTCFPDLGGR